VVVVVVVVCFVCCFVVVWSKLNGLECLVSIPKSNLIIKSPLLIVEREVCVRATTCASSVVQACASRD